LPSCGDAASSSFCPAGFAFSPRESNPIPIRRIRATAPRIAAKLAAPVVACGFLRCVAAITQAAGRRRNERLATQKSVSPFSPEEIVVAATQDRVHCTLVRAGSGSRRLIMATGTVKWFNPTKGYGFIQPQGGGQDVFVHISAVERAGLSTLNEGQQVEYEVVSNRGKSSAENLKVK
jgi:cold shock protein